MSLVSRIPLRIRLTLAFTGVMALVLVATGLFLYLRLGNELDSSIEQGLRSRAGDVAALVAQQGSGLAQSGAGSLTERGENLAQVLDASGAVIDSTLAVRRAPLVPPAVVERALGGENVILDIDPVQGSDDRSRLLVTRVNAAGRDLVAVVGTPIDDRNDALRNLAALLLIGGPVALLLAALAGYGVAAAALRPVERMRAQAAAIQAASPGQRLSPAPADDEIGRLANTLNAMLDRLEEGLERERAFVSDASHELRTPLAILKAELELALRGDRSQEELKAALGSAAEETDRLVQLAEDLLVIARSQEGGLAIHREDTDIGELLSRVRERFLPRARQGGVEIALTSAPGLTAAVDAPRLEQALGNLLDNALRHGGDHVELDATLQGAAVMLRVRDDGPGFPPDFIASAFERFTRADSARGRSPSGTRADSARGRSSSGTPADSAPARGGAGLGLAIVEAIAVAHGGRAGARNRKGAGAEIWIEIPLRGDAEAGAGA